MNEKVGMREVAKRAGVAISSVSRVLTDSPDVSEVMRNRVLDAVAALGYERDLLAMSMRTGATQSIGFVAINVSNPVIATNSVGAENELSKSGYSLLISNSQGNPELDADYIKHFASRRVDGLILSITDEENPRTLEMLRAFKKPIVLIDRELPSDIPAGAVLHDHASGVMPAAQHLINLGHRRIVLISGAPRVRPSRERALALKAAAKSNPDVKVTLIPGGYSEIHGYETTLKIMREPNPPTAIFVGGNQILVGVLRALRELKLKVPTDVSLVTCDDLPLAEFIDPPLARVTRDAMNVGEKAAELLLEQINGAEPRTIILPTSFAVGESCAAPKK
jgi:LacI family transcriptional regulator